MRRRYRLFDLIKQTPLAVGFLLLAGAVTYFIIMLLRWIVDLSGALGVVHTVFSGAAVAIGYAVFVGAVWLYMQKIGANDVDYLKSTRIDASSMKPELFGSGVTFALSLAVYAVLLWAMSLAEWGVFSGPAAYIAAALNLRWGTPFDTVRFWCRAAGFGCCAAALFPAMLFGYKKGFDQRTK